MTKNDRADRNDGDGKQEVTHSARARLMRIARLGLLALMMIFALGNQRCPRDPLRPPALHCQDFPMIIAPGTCEAFDNPCADHQWARAPDTDGLRLTESPSGVTLLFEHNSDESIRSVSVCVAAN